MLLSAPVPRADLAALVGWFSRTAIPQRFMGFICFRPIACPCTHLSCDNAVAESGSWKGLSTAKGLCHLLRCFRHFQEDCRVSAHIKRIQGILNDLADKLSRSCAFHPCLSLRSTRLALIFVTFSVRCPEKRIGCMFSLPVNPLHVFLSCVLASDAGCPFLPVLSLRVSVCPCLVQAYQGLTCP